MYLKRLIVRNSITGEIVRNIPFNEKGLSVIVDETNSKVSGSNIGKTTAVKIIDLCLGAKSVSSLYKEKDTGENLLVKIFLEENKIEAELIINIDNKDFSLKRPLYPRGKPMIDNRLYSYDDYLKELNKMIFNNTSSKPTFPQLISKFIRLDNMNEESLLRYLGNNTKQYEYQALYDYLLGIDESKSKNVDIVALNESINKDIAVIYRKNDVTSLKEFDTKIDLMREQVNTFKQEYYNFSIIDDYKEKEDKIENALLELNELESNFSSKKLKIQLLKEKIEKEQKKIFAFDEKLLASIYEETKIEIKSKLKSFQQLQQFHNGMVNKRIALLRKSLEELEIDTSIVFEKLAIMRKQYETKYVTFNVELREEFEKKYEEYTANKVKLENYLYDYSYIVNKEIEKSNNLKKKVEIDTDKNKRKEIEKEISDYFKELTDKVVGEKFALVLNDNGSDFPIKIVGLNGKPGTGIKKAMIACLDLAHIKLIVARKYHMPTFIVHDKLENIDLKELKAIVEQARILDGQYIFPILSDRIKTLKIREDEIALTLSYKNKFFKIN